MSSRLKQEINNNPSGARDALAGYRYGGLPVYQRRFTGTSPVAGGDVTLFTPSTGTASRLIDFNGHIIRSGANQRHPIASVSPETSLAHASPIFQSTIDGSIHFYNNIAAYASQTYDLVVYYTK